MRKSIVFAALIASVSAAFAWTHGTGTGGTCAFGTSYADGCAAAVAAGDQQSNFFTSYALQSSQTYSTRPPWNVAWVDYATGIPTSQTLTDIAVSQPAHAACSGGWNSTTRVLTCTSPLTDLNISGYDFTSGGTSCGMIIINGGSTGAGVTVTISNNKFAYANAGNCTVAGTQIGVNVSQNGLVMHTVFSHNQIDGGGLVAPAAFRAAFLSVNSYGHVDVTYNHFKHLGSRAVSLNTQGYQNISFNSMDGQSYGYTNYDGTNPLTYVDIQHGEFGLHSSNGSTAQVAINYSFNTLLYDSDNYGANTSIIAASQDAAMNVASYTADHNVLVANRLANWHSSNGVTVASGGTGWSGSNVNDVLTVNDGCATPSKVQITGVTGSAVTAVKPLTGGLCATQPTGTKTTTCISGTCLSAGTGLTIAALYTSSTAGYDLTVGAGTYATGFFAATANYFDPAGANACVSTQGSGITINYSGNINLQDSSTISDEVLANCHNHN